MPPDDAAPSALRVHALSHAPRQSASVAGPEADEAGDEAEDGGPAAEGPAGGLLALLAMSQAPAGAPCAVTVEPVLTATELFGRRDVVVRARIATEAAAGEITLLVDGEPAGRLLLPDGADEGLTQCVAIQIARPGSERAPRLPLRAVVRDRRGRGLEVQAVLALAGGAAGTAAVLGVPATQAAAAEFAPRVMLYVERAMIDGAGMLVAHGWAVGREPVATVQIMADGFPVGAARLGVYRPDVAAVFPAYRDAGLGGFTFAAPLLDALTGSWRRIGRISALAITRDGASQLAVLPAEHDAGASGAVATARAAPDLRTAPGPDAADERRRVQIFCDSAAIGADGRASVSGWAYRPAGLTGAAVRLGERTIDVAASSPLAEIKVAEECGAGLGEPVALRISARGGEQDEAELSGEIAAHDAASDEDVEAASDFRLELDSPAGSGAGAPVRVGAALALRGWALARAGVESIAVLLDDAPLGLAELGLPRPDVQAAHAGQPDALYSGFSFAASLRATPNGEHRMRLIVRDRAGGTFDREVSLLVEKPHASLLMRLAPAERRLREDVAARLGAHAVFAMILRQPGRPDGARSAALGRTLDSLRGQLHARWRLTVAADEPEAAAKWLAWAAAAHPDLTPRVAVVGADDPSPIDAPVPLGDGLARRHEAVDLIGPLGPGDVLGCDALSEFAVEHALHPEARLLYADDIRQSPASGAAEPFFKPDWSPELLLSTDYIGRAWFAAPDAIEPERRGLAAFLSGGGYDALLRATERAGTIRHIPRLLSEQGTGPGEAPEVAAAALAAASARRGIAAAAEKGAAPGSWRLRPAAPWAGLVSVIVPTCFADGVVEECIAFLRASASAAAIEIIAVDTIPEGRPELKVRLAGLADQVVDAAPGPFNWSRLNNEGVLRARGGCLLFLNDDVSDGRPGWLDAMLEAAARPEVGVVGPRLLYPDGTVQHAGMFLAGPSLARHAFRFLDGEDPGYFGLARTQRDVSAVTGACMLMRREVFDALGGFDEAHAVINNDLDFCLRARAAGYRVVFTPHATLTHREGASRKALPEDYDRRAFEQRWGSAFAQGDPFHNPNLSRETDDLAPDEEPVRAVQGGQPALAHADVRRILAVKLDHIGDVMTALPALRLLRERFPGAAVTLLAAGFARSLAEGEASVDAFIGFDFYQRRSGDGPARLTPADYAALRARLAPHRFDLAIDLRKHPDTRDVLRHVPARALAGFDHGGRFPFLDVALEWAADRPLQHKRTHVSEDLLNLVDAVAQACRAPLPLPAPPAPDAAAVRALLPPEAAALWDRLVVAVHPGVGNATRQWPVEHFADLIDLFVMRSRASVVLIGSPDEQAIADAVLARVASPMRVASLVGRTSLGDLARILPHCALYVGNNSGPHHMAAALGVPVIGVHSGVVDAAEWAPAGPRAIALSKQMTCGPCYISQPSQCGRGLACLRLLSPGMVHRWGEWMMARRGEAD